MDESVSRQIVLIVVLILFSFNLVALSADNFSQKLDPILRRLIEKNEKSLEETDEPLNLAPYADRLEVYSDSQPLEVKRNKVMTKEGRTKYRYEIPEGAQGHRLGLLINTSSPTMVEAKGVPVRTVAGEIVTAVATLKQVKELGLLPSVGYIQASRRMELHLNKSVPAVGANELQNENPKLRGEGIIIGAIDTGIDYDHRDFRVEKVPGDGVEEETSRIQYIWDQLGGPGPSPMFFGYGTEYDKSEIESDIASGAGPASGEVLEDDPEGHGTHVMGISAGDGSSTSAAKYVGMAPEADIIMVKTTFYDAEIIDGVNYVFQKAENRGKPAVVNLSLGGHYGPHDGTSLFSRALDALSGPGKIIVVAAGNEGDLFIHGGGDISPGSSKRIPFKIKGPSGGGKLEGAVAINSWYPGDSEFSVKVISPGGYNLTVPSGVQTSSVTPDGTIFVDNAFAGPNPQNGDKELEVNIIGPDYGGTPVTPGDWAMVISAPSGTDGGRFDSWYHYGPGFIQPPVGDNRMSVGTPGVAKEVITAGAWTTKTRWMGADGEEHGYKGFTPSEEGNIAYFSSLGPTRDGRLKPEITAPGFGIASSLADAYVPLLKSQGLYDVIVTEDEKHVIMSGTSMSTPHVAGQVALLLQQKPNSTPSEVKARLSNTANSDQYTSVGYDPKTGEFTRNTGPVSNYTWGSGKMDSAQAGRTLGFAADQLGKFKVKFGPNPAPASEEVYLYYQLPGSSDGTLEVFNAAGRQVYSASLPSEKDVYQWSLENKRGQPLANGVYLYVVKAGNRTSNIGKLMIERK